ncbi:Lrp/AsnC family transcriptional regulator [Halobacteriales archaeon Cl-PHB]
MTAHLATADRAILNAFQGGFPIMHKPFGPAATALQAGGVALSTPGLVSRLSRLVDRDVVSRFGPLIDTEATGGTTTLVAMHVPADRFESVAAIVNDVPEVAHNYERDHLLNCWFVLTVPESGTVGAVLADIEDATGLTTYDLPKRREFHLGARFPIEGPFDDEGVDLTTVEGGEVPTAESAGADGLSEAEYDLLLAVQDGLPLSETPYADVADAIDADTAWVVDTLRRFRASGVVRRVGVIPNHYAIGYTENAMTVWDLPDDAVGSVGTAVGDLPFVTHCYERPRHDGVWPYNLFAMVHGRTEAECRERREAVRSAVADHVDLAASDHEVLYSRRILKKTGVRFVDRDRQPSDA